MTDGSASQACKHCVPEESQHVGDHWGILHWTLFFVAVMVSIGIAAWYLVAPDAVPQILLLPGTWIPFLIIWNLAIRGFGDRLTVGITDFKAHVHQPSDLLVGVKAALKIAPGWFGKSRLFGPPADNGWKVQATRERLTFIDGRGGQLGIPYTSVGRCVPCRLTKKHFLHPSCVQCALNLVSRFHSISEIMSASLNPQERAVVAGSINKHASS